jgi:hypothetical protein
MTKQPYIQPQVVDYGSIADCTFITPAGGGQATTVKGIDGSWVCTDTPADSHVFGHKNYIVLKCDKFGEFSHS